MNGHLGRFMVLALLAGSATGFGGISVAAEGGYRFELLGSYDRSDSSSLESELVLFGAAAHFERVDAQEGPLAEADFLERKGYIAGVAGHNRLDIGGAPTLKGPVFGVELVYAQPGVPVSASVNYVRVDRESASSSRVDMTTDGYGGSLGVFLTDGFLLGVTYDHLDMDVSGPGGSAELTTDSVSLGGKYLRLLDSGRAVNLEIELAAVRDRQDGDREDLNYVLDAAADYYFTRALSLGGGVAYDLGEDEAGEGVTLSVAAEVFPLPAIALAVSYEKFLAEQDQSDDSDSLGARLLGRF